MTQVQQGSSEAAEAAVAGAVVPKGRKALTEMIEANMAEIEKALPPHVMSADRFARIVLTELRKTPKLLQCTPESFLGALFQTAQLGLEPGGQLGHAFLIPYDRTNRDTREKVTECQLQIGYKGYIELGGRRGIIMRARELRENDDFSFDLGSNEFLHHTWRPGKDRGGIIAYWGKVVMPDGRVTFSVMEMDEIYERRDRSSAVQYAKTHSWVKTPWDTDEVAMCRKTVVRAMVPQVALAPELQQALRADEAVIERGVAGDLQYIYRDALDAASSDSRATTGEITKGDVAEALNAMENNQERLRCSKYLLDNFGSVEQTTDEMAPAMLTIIQEWPAVLGKGQVSQKPDEPELGDSTKQILGELDDELEAQAREHVIEWIGQQADKPNDDQAALELERWLNEPQDAATEPPPAAQTAGEPADAAGEDPGPPDPQEPAAAQQAHAKAVGVSDELLASTKLAIDSWDADTCKRILREWGQPVAGKVEVLRLRLLEVLAPARAAENPMAVNLF